MRAAAEPPLRVARVVELSQNDARSFIVGVRCCWCARLHRHVLTVGDYEYGGTERLAVCRAGRYRMVPGVEVAGQVPAVLVELLGPGPTIPAPCKVSEVAGGAR